MMFRKTALFLFTLILCISLYGQEPSAVRRASSGGIPEKSVLADAYNAFSSGDYKSAVFLFKKALSDPQNQSDGALYMLMTANLYTGNYRAACADSEYFLETYPDSSYAPVVKYQRGRILFKLKDYDKALLVLGDFCHEYPDNMMYASALFWIGECFFATCNFDRAQPFYERILEEFPRDAKAVDAGYRLDAINAYSRQDKLLYMLQQTGEDFLASRESYEKALRRYELEDSLGLRRNSREKGSAEEAEESAPGIVLFHEDVPESEPLVDKAVADALSRLKQTAARVQVLLDGEAAE